MKESKQIAKNYAQALYELTNEEIFLNEIKSVNECINQVKNIKQIFENPGIAKDEKKRIVETFQSGVSRTTMNFLYVLIDNKRFSLLPEIQNQLYKLVNQSKGIVLAEVYSAAKIDIDTLENLKQRLGKTFGQNKRITIES